MQNEKPSEPIKLGNLIRHPSIRSALVITGGYILSFAVAYALFSLLSSKMAVKNAVKAAQAYWDEERRLNNVRLFGQEDV